MTGKLLLEDGSQFEGISFGANTSVAGEVVFSTGMVGYPQGMTDPSFEGQILIFTYPIIGSYGVPDKSQWESDRIHTSGIVVSQYIDTPSSYSSKQTLSSWLKSQNIPGLEIKDTRLLTQKIRSSGAMLGKIILDKNVADYDPNSENIVANVSTKKITELLPEGNTYKKTVLLVDCGAKNNIERSFLKRGVRVFKVPWDFDPFVNPSIPFDALFISNGPGDPKMATKTIAMIKKALQTDIPILGICLGNQLLALAAGGDTYKLKFGHRSQNQPCLLAGSKRCFITTQNHGFAVSNDLPKGFKPWFTNANDNSNEGIIHQSRPVMSVQFHPEATPGPTDCEWIFDYFLEKL
ncbi:MAG TPA: glutamine-hydrolyzing carbamoyl-phosphate synthase small subunit [Candidatus Saccharimonadales bacterium]|nr:glutamine-hydrolyzing carbamoyl-phosphate synthase small subunit [Candidatus Saccharimonadales bacterium]